MLNIICLQNMKNEMKSRYDKVKEVVEITKKLRGLGLDDSIGEVKEFSDICREYIDTENTYEGKINIPQAKRVLEYRLPRRKMNEIKVNLKYKEFP